MELVQLREHVSFGCKTRKQIPYGKDLSLHRGVVGFSDPHRLAGCKVCVCE